MKDLNISTTTTCLIIDGDRYALDEMESYLTELPWIVLTGTATDVRGAREILSKNDNVDVVFLGTGACNSHAFEIARELRDRVRCMVFIGDDNESAWRAFQVGGDHFLQRPLTRSKLRTTVPTLIIETLQTEDWKVSQKNLWIPLHLDKYSN
ncbi:hypothetical protein GCM10022246_08030 [Pedobacter ginsengiterrae]|uniref:Response regulatory domain-containing protein n=1 Tax=Pedobacter ginsengiterrae TaxID=871696 RepID=A0ABP7NYC4_9SPHI